MPRLSRRSFLAASAALVAAPALAAPYGGDVDVVIVGAGAAGIAAARRITAAKRSFALIEAGNRIGGRCVTDAKIFGVPYDHGAHWIRNSDGNPLVALTSKSGLDIDPASRAQSLRVGPRSARDSELEGFLGRAGALAPRHRRRRARQDGYGGRARAAARSRRLAGRRSNSCSDRSAAARISRMSPPWILPARSSATAMRSAGRAMARCSARLAGDLHVRLSMPVSMIYWGKNLVVETPKGDMRPRAVILTVSTNVLASEKIEFIPPLPKRQLDAAAKLSLGSYDHIALELPGNPLGLQRDDVVFEQSSGPRTAALLANVSGTPLHLVEVAGQFGRELSTKGEAAMVEFARDWLASLFGSTVKRAVKRSHATRWNADPFALGAMSAAAPGNADARKILCEPIGGKLWLAGEALHETQWGTVNGAWESGTRTAEAVLRRLGALKDPEDEKPARKSQTASKG